MAPRQAKVKRTGRDKPREPIFETPKEKKVKDEFVLPKPTGATLESLSKTVEKFMKYQESSLQSRLDQYKYVAGFVPETVDPKSREHITATLFLYQQIQQRERDLGLSVRLLLEYRRNCTLMFMNDSINEPYCELLSKTHGKEKRFAGIKETFEYINNLKLRKNDNIFANHPLMQKICGKSSYELATYIKKQILNEFAMEIYNETEKKWLERVTEENETIKTMHTALQVYLLQFSEMLHLSGNIAEKITVVDIQNFIAELKYGSHKEANPFFRLTDIDKFDPNQKKIYLDMLESYYPGASKMSLTEFMTSVSSSKIKRTGGTGEIDEIFASLISVFIYFFLFVVARSFMSTKTTIFILLLLLVISSTPLSSLDMKSVAEFGGNLTTAVSNWDISAIGSTLASGVYAISSKAMSSAVSTVLAPFSVNNYQEFTYSDILNVIKNETIRDSPVFQGALNETLLEIYNSTDFSDYNQQGPRQKLGNVSATSENLDIISGDLFFNYAQVEVAKMGTTIDQLQEMPPETEGFFKSIINTALNKMNGVKEEADKIMRKNETEIPEKLLSWSERAVEELIYYPLYSAAYLTRNGIEKSLPYQPFQSFEELYMRTLKKMLYYSDLRSYELTERTYFGRFTRGITHFTMFFVAPYTSLLAENAHVFSAALYQLPNWFEPYDVYMHPALVGVFLLFFAGYLNSRERTRNVIADEWIRNITNTRGSDRNYPNAVTGILRSILQPGSDMIRIYDGLASTLTSTTGRRSAQIKALSSILGLMGTTMTLVGVHQLNGSVDPLADSLNLMRNIEATIGIINLMIYLQTVSQNKMLDYLSPEGSTQIKTRAFLRQTQVFKSVEKMRYTFFSNANLGRQTDFDAMLYDDVLNMRQHSMTDRAPSGKEILRVDEITSDAMIYGSYSRKARDELLKSQEKINFGLTLASVSSVDLFELSERAEYASAWSKVNYILNFIRTSQSSVEYNKILTNALLEYTTNLTTNNDQNVLNRQIDEYVGQITESIKTISTKPSIVSIFWRRIPENSRRVIPLHRVKTDDSQVAKIRENAKHVFSVPKISTTVGGETGDETINTMIKNQLYNLDDMSEPARKELKSIEISSILVNMENIKANLPDLDRSYNSEKQIYEKILDWIEERFYIYRTVVNNITGTDLKSELGKRYGTKKPISQLNLYIFSMMRYLLNEKHDSSIVPDYIKEPLKVTLMDTQTIVQTFYSFKDEVEKTSKDTTATDVTYGPLFLVSK